jgi:hypothetical protein
MPNLPDSRRSCERGSEPRAGEVARLTHRRLDFTGLIGWVREFAAAAGPSGYGRRAVGVRAQGEPGGAAGVWVGAGASVTVQVSGETIA